VSELVGSLHGSLEELPCFGRAQLKTPQSTPIGVRVKVIPARKRLEREVKVTVLVQELKPIRGACLFRIVRFAQGLLPHVEDRPGH